MRVLIINSVCGHGSTGKICGAIAEDYEKQGCEVKIAYGRDSFVPERYQKYAVRIGSDIQVRIHGVRSRLLDDHGLGSVSDTKKFLRFAEEFSPDIVWIHNIHGYFINYKLLFDWIKSRPDMQVKWTLHDCWAFTGHCTHFSVVGCYKWKEHCERCPQKKAYPASLFRDNSYANFETKKAAFTGVPNMTIYTPSEWLANLARQSFLREYPIEVKYNEIDTSVFCPTPSDFREKYSIENKKMILGVASVWSANKGLSDFVKLSKMLDDNYKIVLVGLSEAQIASLPENILGLTRTTNAKELAQIYTAADIFLNPSLEETFGLTTVEALSCGTFAVVYKNTACEEIVKIYGGVAVEHGAENLYSAVTEYFLNNN